MMQAERLINGSVKVKTNNDCSSRLPLRERSPLEPIPSQHKKGITTVFLTIIVLFNKGTPSVGKIANTRQLNNK